jgi:hypothetical protein
MTPMNSTIESTGAICSYSTRHHIRRHCNSEVRLPKVTGYNLTFAPRKYFCTAVEGEKTGDGISYASQVKNPNPLKARATTFYDHNALDKEAQCAWKEGEGSDWPSVYIQKPFMTL